jgi:WD40 repeat protein
MSNPHRDDTDTNASGPLLRCVSRPGIRGICTGIVGALLCTFTGQAQGPIGWGPAQLVDARTGNINTGALEGCPIEGPDGHYLFFASNRANGYGGNDIWAAYRPSVQDEFLVPHVLPGSLQPPESVNSTANDFCPTPLTGGRLMFVSTRVSAQCGTAGIANIYETRLDPALGWLEPHVLPCDGPDSINSAWDEFSPSLIEAEGRTILFFSSGRDGMQKIYMSERQPDGPWGPATRVEELNSAAQDARPNVSDDGLEIVFDSTRQGANPDIWTARRTSLSKPWSTPVRLGTNVNSEASETRASLSRDGRRLYFGSNRNGTSDIFVSMRSWPDGK